MLFTGGLVELPAEKRLLRELRLLELHRHRGGRQSVDHPSNGHDDCANAVCGVLRNLADYMGFNTDYRWMNGEPNPDGSDPGNWLQLREQLYLQSGGSFKLW